MIKIICVGKLKEKYLEAASREYIKRISKYTNIEIIEILDSAIDDKKIAIEKEKLGIQKHLTGKEYVITLEIEGKEISSVEFSKELDKKLMINSNITFIIGGSHGIHSDIKNISNFRLSFSKMTFPHQLFRVMLLEQIYRSYKIMNNEKYHK